MPKPRQPSSAFILVADDDPIVCDVIRDTLQSAGYAAEIFQDPALLVAALPTFHRTPDLLVADYRMPNMNGLELIQQCKAKLPNLKAVSLSGTLSLSEIDKYALKPDKTLSKPFLPSDLIDAIESLLNPP
jgi:CheY-like chemotaxis protein